MSPSARGTPVSGSADQALADIVAEITDRLHRGEVVPLDEYLTRYPEFADRLPHLLPALEVLHAIGSAPDDKQRALRNGNDEIHTTGGTLGDFRIIREVGRGGMGVVYEAEQISLKRRVALKVLPFAATMDQRHLQRFKNESIAAASLEHPHIVPVYGVGCERGVHYYAMKFIEGRSLAEIIEAQRIPSEPRSLSEPRLLFEPRSLSEPRPSGRGEPQPLPDGRGSEKTSPVAAASTQRAPRDAAAFRQIAEWGIQAAEALELAHSVGIVHRDIKPANLMVDGQGKLWITDFGLARTATDVGLTMTGDVLGTLRYMSPEQALAKHGLDDHRTDVYSLGVTLYELLTGTPAVSGEDREEILNAITLDQPQPPQSLDAAIPHDLETIVLKALEKGPADRYQSALALAEDLERFLDDKPIMARRPSVVQLVKKWSRKHGPAVLSTTIVLVLLLVLLTVGILLIWREKTAKEAALNRAELNELTAQQEARKAERLTARLALDRDWPCASRARGTSACCG